MGDDGLLERDHELGLLVDRLDGARAGRGGIALVEGPAGSGKTALLGGLRTAAEQAGDVRVVQAVGGELEREFSFGVVRQLLERVVRGADAPRREELLSGAALHAAPIVGAAPDPAEPVTDASFATLHGLYWLVATLAEERPLLLLVDDAHWSDAPSLRFLDFLARRAHELPLLVVVGTRVGEPGAAHDLLDALAAVPDAAVARPQPLSPAAVRALFGAEAADDAISAAVDATRGNPLLVRELVRSLRAAGGGPATAEAVGAAVPSSVTRSVERRIARVSPTARDVAQALAVLGDRTDREVLAGVVETSEAEVDEALAALRAIELLEDDPPRFLHPLVRAAAAEPLTTHERDRLHRRAAELLRQRPGAEEAAVLHLLAARPIGAPWAAWLLRDSARRALATGDPDAAVRRLRRALEEAAADADPEERLALELELGRAAARAGDPSASEHLAVAALSASPAVAAQAIEETRVGPGDALADAVETLRTALARTGDDDAELRDRIAGQLLNALMQDLRLAPERATTLAQLAAQPSRGVLAHLTYEAAAGAARADDVLALARRTLAGRPFAQLRAIEHPTLFWVVMALTAVDGAELATNALAEADATARRHRTRLGSAFVAFLRAEAALAFGSAALAEADARDALELFGRVPGNTVAIGARCALIRALVLRGGLEEGERLLGELPADDELEHAWGGTLVWTARSELRLAQGRPADTLADLERVERVNAAFGWERMPFGHQAARKARALIALGRVDEGRSLAEAELASARGRGVASFAAEAGMALALTLEGDDAASVLLDAATDAARAPSLRVRAQVAYELGVRLRRDGKRIDARDHLSAARDLAVRADASALAAKATEELLVAGGRPRRVARDGVDALTPAERRTAEHAARGLSNREIAETLFVTRKTVEFTLGNVYTKLGIRSRTQLPGALGVEAAAE